MRRHLPRRMKLCPNRLTKSLRPRKRHLKFESLEERRLLAIDCCLPQDCCLPRDDEGSEFVTVRLEPADPITLEPLSTVHEGAEFLLLAYVQDERPQAAGVFAAYFDVTYPASSFLPQPLPEGGSLFYDSQFRNGISGDTNQIGLVDEFGAFSSNSSEPGSDEQLIGGVLLVPTQTGQVTISTNPADDQPFHAFLLFNADDPVASDQINFLDLQLDVQAPLPEKLVTAINDSFSVAENSEERLLEVLANDENYAGGSLKIGAIDTTDTRGNVRVGNHGSIVIYTPEPGFVGLDRFHYTVSAAGEQDTGTVVVDVRRGPTTEQLVRYTYQIINEEGLVTSTVTVGDKFDLQVVVEDLRGLPEGVFATYSDVQYTSNAVAVAGPIVFGSAYQNGTSGDTPISGLIDEVGAFSDVNPLGAGQETLFTLSFEATEVGRVIFDGNPADVLPENVTLLYGLDEPVLEGQIEYGRISLDVLPGVIAVDDSFHLPLDIASELSVLDNDVNRSAGSMRIDSVSSVGVLGKVSVINDGRTIAYVPPPNFEGSEQFTYDLRGGLGSDRGTVTVHLGPTSQTNDLLSIALQTTDLNGQRIDAVAAGDEFLVQAFVQDLRATNPDPGVFAAYLDVLYENQHVRPVLDGTRPRIEFTGPYANGISGSSVVPGLLDDIGAFQASSEPLGESQQLLFSASFLATPSQGEPDVFDVVEDGEANLDVLINDRPNDGRVVFRADPSDVVPQSEVLLYEPPEAVSFQQISFVDATIDITTGGTSLIASVGATTNGGVVTVVDAGQQLLYSPAADFSGVDRFTYSLDGATEIDVAVNVLPVNDAPVAFGDVYRGRQGRELEVSANRGVLANDLDVDGDSVRPILISEPVSGHLTLHENGAFTYLPGADFVGTDRFTYRVTDGLLQSEAVTVTFEIVPTPVGVRLQTVDQSGRGTSEFSADQPVGVRALVQDLRGVEQLFPGLGAAYLDIAYDSAEIAPLPDSGNSLGFQIDFAPSYTNGLQGEVLSTGRLNDVGAFQSGFSPLGGNELELFTATFQLAAPRAADDSFRVPKAGQVLLDVLRNDVDLRWQVVLDAQHANGSPLADVLYFNPAVAVPERDINYIDATLTARNGNLSIDAVSPTEQGGNVHISGKSVQYLAPAGFVGTDRFTYTAIDARGAIATATVNVEIVQGWHNPDNPLDVSQDRKVSPLDALISFLIQNTRH